MNPRSARADSVRFSLNNYQNHVVDEYAAGRMGRRTFLRAASVVGISAGAAALLTACGPYAGGGERQSNNGGVTAGGVIKAGCLAPGAAIEPTTLVSAGGVCLFTQTLEYLSLSNGEPELRPVLATGWEPNDDATVWTFDIRRGVTFSDGAPLTARDVAATFNRITDPDSGSSALNTIGGILSTGGATASDDHTVVFELERPTGAFSWLISSDLFGAAILPEDYDGDFETTWVGTGPWILEEFVRDEYARFVRNEDYWGDAALPDSVEFTLFEDGAAMLLALQSRSIEVVNSLTYAAGRAIVEDTERFTTRALQSAAHRHWHLRTDTAPVDDARVRRAIALSIDREVIVESALNGLADIGNDSPFAPVFASSPANGRQRTRDLDQARSLLAEAGYDGAAIRFVVRDVHELSEVGQMLQSQLGEAGIAVDLEVLDGSTWLGDGLDASPGLDAAMGMDSWGSRGVPNAFLSSQLASSGTSNASRYQNAELDGLIDQYTATIDLQSQRQIAGEIEEILHEDTPAIYSYFVNWLSASVTELSGYEFTAMGSLLLSRAGREE